MQNLAEFAIPYSFSGEEESAFASRQLIWAFASIAKSAIDAGDITTAERVLGYMGGLYDSAQGRPRGDWDRRSRRTSGRTGLDPVRSRQEAPEPPVHVPLDAFPRRHYLPDMVLVLRAYETYRDEAPWRYWETGTRSRFAPRPDFENYFRRAVLLVRSGPKTSSWGGGQPVGTIRPLPGDAGCW